VTATNASAIVPASPDAVFRTLTDIAGLPAWNARMTSVIDQPVALEVGAVWVVEFQVLGRSWRSRSTVEEIDVAGRRFAYRSPHRRRQPVLCGLGVERG
jgi:uncharacterized protein YndB with AHSA1/START domain